MQTSLKKAISGFENTGLYLVNDYKFNEEYFKSAENLQPLTIDDAEDEEILQT